MDEIDQPFGIDEDVLNETQKILYFSEEAELTELGEALRDGLSLSTRALFVVNTGKETSFFINPDNLSCPFE